MMYLLIILLNGIPQPSRYRTEQDACAAQAANPGSFLFVETGKRGEVALPKGECKPVQQIITIDK
jgi:hypothetical protein